MSAAAHRPDGDVEPLLENLRRTAAVIADGPRPPVRVRLEADGVSLELEWRPGATTPAPAVPLLPPVLSAVPNPVEPDVTGGPGGHVITAGNVGVFHRTPQPGAAPFVVEGDTVSSGQQVGIIEAMKMMIPVQADRSGRVERVLCESGTSVQFGTPLLVLAGPVTS